MSAEVKRMFKVICPIERNGKTYWQRLGSGFPNRDQSINLYLDALPTNGKLQLREVDEEDLERARRGERAGGREGRAAGGRAGDAANDDLPF
jgi:protein associated with RNAse G/E